MSLGILVNLKNTFVSGFEELQIINQNAAGMSQAGFKEVSVSYETTFSEALLGATETRNPLQFGESTRISQTKTNFADGPLGFGTKDDAAIQGQGFFIVGRNPLDTSEGSAKSLTRNGEFHYSSDGVMRTASDFPVYGFKVDENGTPITGSIEVINVSGHTDLGVTDGGLIVDNYQANQDDATVETVPLFRLALSKTPNPQGMVRKQGAVFEPSSASGELLQPGIADDDGYGSIFGGQLEGSNVSISKLAFDQVTMTRKMEAWQGATDKSDKFLSGSISKLGG